MLLQRFSVWLEAENLIVPAHFVAKDELWPERCLGRGFLKDSICSFTVVEYDEGLAEDRDMADWAIQVFELDPVLVFWRCPIWHILDVAKNGEGLGARREVLAGFSPNVEYCEGNAHKN